MAETILIVDDEESVRRTFQDWLQTSGLGCAVRAVADAESALMLANQHPIDLAILDWNLGSGSDGLQLLEDLVEFHPDIVAILVTGFAHQATPLEALRMGVRDYLDKNQDLNRDTFLHAVSRQLERIIPAKRQRHFTQSLLAFRESIEKVLPLVQGSTTLNDPVPLPEAIRHLFRFLQRTTRCRDGALVVRQVADNKEHFLAYSGEGKLIASPNVPFARSLAATAVSLQEPCALTQEDLTSLGTLELQPFEQNRKHLLLAPLPVGSGTHVVLELFDKEVGDGFTSEDRKLVSAAAEFGTELLRQALAEHQTHKILFNALEDALEASKRFVTDSANGKPSADFPPELIINRLRQGLEATTNSLVDAEKSIRLVEAIRVLAIKHGSLAVDHCIHLVESLKDLLDGITGEIRR
jgi:two-component system, NtrC family, nitrogen regulation response regulator NtrX